MQEALKGPRNHLTALKKKLHGEIPATRRLGIEPVRCSKETLVLKAPLALNHNDKGTAFAGSLSAVVTVAGWSAVWLAIQEAGLQGVIVIQDGAIRYRRPVTRDFEARASLPTPAQRARLLAALRKHGKARTDARVVIRESGADAVTFTGRYVVWLPK